MDKIFVSDKWLKAAVIGGIWASIEIVVGSFLHNLRIPFAGTILATQGILILIAFNQVWRESGIIIRAGIITALMKSVSPSSVILGPMIGILMEAAILEFVLYIFGKRLLGIILASSLALSSALIHKVFSIIILYGWNITLIYKNIYLYLQKLFNTDLLSPIEFVFLILAIYLFFGSAAGIFGKYIGKKALLLIPKPNNITNEFETDEIFPLSGNQSFNLYLLALNILLIPLGLLFISLDLLKFGIPFLLFFIIYSFWRYANIFRRLKKPIFWGQLVIIILLSGLFYGKSNDSIFSLEGLLFGFEMSFRALFIVIGFTSISIELRNPSIKKFLYAHHLGALHASLSLAFSSLPIIMKSLPPIKLFFKQPLKTFAQLIASNIQWYSIFKKQVNN